MVRCPPRTLDRGLRPSGWNTAVSPHYSTPCAPCGREAHEINWQAEFPHARLPAGAPPRPEYHLECPPAGERPVMYVGPRHLASLMQRRPSRT